MNLSKVSETTNSVTLGWAPPVGVGAYAFYAAGQIVSVASRNLRDGAPRTTVSFHKTTPGPPFQVAALCRIATGAFSVDAGTYPITTSSVYPATSVFPSEMRP